MNCERCGTPFPEVKIPEWLLDIPDHRPGKRPLTLGELRDLKKKVEIGDPPPCAICFAPHPLSNESP